MTEKVNVLLVDGQPEKLPAYEVILRSLNENLVTASSAREALGFLLKNDVAVVLIGECMQEIDGFELAALIREHPRFQKTAIVFISAIQVSDAGRLSCYETVAVDCVPAIPDLLRAKVRIFADLFRKTRALENLNLQLERYVAERTAELEESNARLVQSEQGRSLALAAGQMGSWDWDIVANVWKWDEGQYRIFGVDPGSFQVTLENVRSLIHPQDFDRLLLCAESLAKSLRTQRIEFRVRRPNGEIRWCAGTVAASVNAGRVVQLAGVTIDVTDRKATEERQILLAREVDHRARNALAAIQSIIRLTRANTVEDYLFTVEGRITALARAHTLLSDSRWHGADLATLVADELAPYQACDKVMIGGPDICLHASTAQSLALALHELATNAAKHGALSSERGGITVSWELLPDAVLLKWVESGGPEVLPPLAKSFGLRLIRASIEQQLEGKASFDWSPQGLRCDIWIPRHELINAVPPVLDRTRGKLNDVQHAARGTGKPLVLLVEDEALVAIMIQESLVEFGFQVVGPISSASEALVKATDGHFHAAVLDINLADGLVYPVADLLTARRVPFVFVTGYDSEMIDHRFSEISILQKPIEREMLKVLLTTQRADRRSRISYFLAQNSGG